MNLAIFDIDGTLTLGTSHFKVFVAALESTCGFQNVSANWNDYHHPSDSGIVDQVSHQQLGRSLTDDELERFKGEYLARLREACCVAHAVPGAAEFLATLEGDGKWALAYATGNWRATGRCKLASAGLPSETFPLSGAEDGPSRVQILQMAIEKSQAHWGVASFQRIVSFGDALWDLGAARDLGLPFVGLDTMDRGSEMLSAGTSHLLPDFTDLSQAMLALNEARAPH